MQQMRDTIVGVCSVNSITAAVTGWQQRCWELAEANMPFELRDIQTRHFIFCHQLCAEYAYHFAYKYVPGHSAALFRPKHRDPLPDGPATINRAV